MDAQTTTPYAHRARHLLRGAIIFVICLSVALLLSVDTVYAGIQAMLEAAGSLIEEHPLLGPVVFVVFSALSAVLAFFSSALLVPAAVYSWGEFTAVALLWLGWLLGGMLTYALGHGLRKPGAPATKVGERLMAYLPDGQREVGFALVLLWQLALPSEIPGYLCGYLRVPFRTYVAALAIAELPYAMGAVWLGESVVNRRLGLLVALGVVGATLGYFLLRSLRRRMHQA